MANSQHPSSDLYSVLKKQIQAISLILKLLMSYIHIYIYIYDISSLRVNDLTLILLMWRKWWTPNNANKWLMGFNSAFKGLRGVVQENAGKYCVKLCYNKKGNVGTYNNVARPCNHCCRGKAINITHSECASVALGIQHAMCMRHIVICGLPGPKIFFHIIS